MTPDISQPTTHPQAEATVATDQHAPLDMLGLLDGTLFAPKVTFALLTPNTVTMLQSLAWMVITALVVLLGQVFWKDDTIGIGWLAVISLWTAFASVLAILILAWVILALGRIFALPCSYRVLVSVLSLSSLPWLLYGPLAMFKVSFPFAGPLLAFFAGLAIWGWHLALFALGLSAAFAMPISRAALLMLLPLGMAWWCLYALGQLFTIFGRLLP